MARGEVGNNLPWVFTSYTFIWFATPAFAFLTGALVWNYRPIRTRQDLVSFFRRRASVVVYPYLVWSAFYIWFGHYTPADLRPQMPLGEYAVDVARLLVLGRASFHLYFLPVVLIFYVVSPVVSRLFARWPWPTFLVLFAIGAFATILIPEPPSDRVVTVYRLFHSTMWLLPPAAVGGLYGALRTRHAVFLSRAWPLVLAVGLFMRWYDRGPLYVENVWLQRINEYTYLGLTLVGLVCLFDVLATKAPSLGSAGRWLGAGALGVYLIHPVAIWLVGQALEQRGATDLWLQPWFTLAVSAGVVAVCYAIVTAAGRLRALAWAFGMPGGLARRLGAGQESRLR
jgi:surface polysaccharide O-acyltransferase-like enzyme